MHLFFFLILEQSCDQKQYYFSSIYTITVFILNKIYFDFSF